MARPFYKTSGFGCTVNFDFASLYLQCLVANFLNTRYVDLSLRLINLAVHSESNDILSFRSYFQSKGGTFFETPGRSACCVP